MDTTRMIRKAAILPAKRGQVTIPPMSPRTPLTASQHILHLLLTVFTGGLWAPVWIIRAIQGNR